MKATIEISMRERERIVEDEEYGLGGESLMTHLKSGLLKMSIAI